MRERPSDRRASRIVEFEHAGRRYRASASRFPDGRIAEVFLDIGKSGSDVQAHADIAAILASVALQHGVPAAVLGRSITGPLAVALAKFEEAC